MSKFKVGDKVKLNKIVGNFKYGRGEVNFKTIGKIIGITENNEYYVDFPVCRCWHGREKELVLVKEKYNYEDLKKSPVGTKITFENGKVLIKLAEDYYRETEINGIFRHLEDLDNLEDNYEHINQGKIIKIEEPEYRTVYEVKDEILDKAEKRYLRGIIVPFKDKVICIRKSKNLIEILEYIAIELKGDSSICLPYFEPNTMYKGMKLDKKYTLKELGL